MVFRDDYLDGVFVDDDHILNLCRTKRICDEDGRVVAPLQDVDLLAHQFSNDVLDPDSSKTHARTDGVDIVFVRVDGDLAAGASLPRNRLDFYEAGLNFWNF